MWDKYYPSVNEAAAWGLYADPEGGVESLFVTSGVEWFVSSNRPWISISPANGVGSTKCSILVDSTLQNGLRDAKLTFQTVEGDQYFVMVEQGGYGKFINLKDTAMTIASATNSVADRYFEVEVRTMDDVKEVLALDGIQRIMFDNFSVEQTREAVALVAGRCETESSGGITLETLRDYAETGVDFISVGALTHQIKSLDMSLKAC